MRETTITIDQDELEYTRDGLNTRKLIPLVVGARNRLVIRRPERERVKTLAGFPYNSAFPGAALAGLLSDRALVRRLSELPDSARIQVFGHANLEDNLDHNKRLSQRVLRELVDGTKFDAIPKMFAPDLEARGFPSDLAGALTN